MTMRWMVFSVLAMILAGIICIPGAGAQPLPEYEKILQIHLNYQDSRFVVSAQEVRYGRARNLDIISGNFKGVILDAKGKELKSFSLQEPGIAYGDILAPPDGDSLIGFTERQASGDMIIILPYLQDMQKFSLSDSRDGTLLVSADLNPPVAAFCSDYPYDPDCRARIPSLPSAVPDTGTYLVLAGLFSASVVVAAGMAMWTARHRIKEKTPGKQVVLIVDDDPENISLINILLDKKGYATLKASGGQECLDILRTQCPDTILLDVRMTPMDGWQTLEQIRKNPGTRSIPVLMLTGKRLTAAEARQYKICIDDYIEKPFRPAELYTAIENVIVRKQQLKETLVLARQAGVDKEKFCEFARLTRRISVDRKIAGILQGPQSIPVLADLEALDDMSVIDYINVKTRDHEKRVEQLRLEINSAFRSKGLPELSW